MGIEDVRTGVFTQIFKAKPCTFMTLSFNTLLRDQLVMRQSLSGNLNVLTPV